MTSRLPIPTDLGAIDARWISAALEIDVAAIRPLPASGGIPMTSRIARLALESASPSAPRSVVVKITKPSWAGSSELHEREVRFYREIASRGGVPAPRCYYADGDPGSGAFVLVLEDLSELEPGHRLDGLTSEEADAVIDGIAALHRSWWGRPELDEMERRGHDRARIARTLETFDARWPELEASGKFPIDDALRAALELCRARYPAGMEAVSSEPQTLIHSDLHVENYFLEATATGLKLWVIDWQNPRHGHGAFDLAQIIASLRPELIAGELDRLVDRYRAAVAAPVPDLGARVAAVVRHMFICSASWVATFEAQTLRDAETLQGHWTRLAAALIAIEATTNVSQFAGQP